MISNELWRNSRKRKRSSFPVALIFSYMDSKDLHWNEIKYWKITEIYRNWQGLNFIYAPHLFRCVMWPLRQLVSGRHNLLSLGQSSTSTCRHLDENISRKFNNKSVVIWKQREFGSKFSSVFLNVRKTFNLVLIF